jgi:hypothetical protein
MVQKCLKIVELSLNLIENVKHFFQKISLKKKLTLTKALSVPCKYYGGTDKHGFQICLNKKHDNDFCYWSNPFMFYRCLFNPKYNPFVVIEVDKMNGTTSIN